MAILMGHDFDVVHVISSKFMGLLLYGNVTCVPNGSAHLGEGFLEITTRLWEMKDTDTGLKWRPLLLTLLYFGGGPHL